MFWESLDSSIMKGQDELYEAMSADQPVSQCLWHLQYTHRAPRFFTNWPNDHIWLPSWADMVRHVIDNRTLNIDVNWEMSSLDSLSVQETRRKCRHPDYLYSVYISFLYSTEIVSDCFCIWIRYVDTLSLTSSPCLRDLACSQNIPSPKS